MTNNQITADDPGFVFSEHALGQDWAVYDKKAKELLGKYTLLDKSLHAWVERGDWVAGGEPNARAKTVAVWHDMYIGHLGVLGSPREPREGYLGTTRQLHLRPLHKLRFKGYYGYEYICLLKEGRDLFYTKSKSEEASLFLCDERMDHRRKVKLDDKFTQFAGVPMIRILGAKK